jgi:hypothetical protein
MLAVLIFAWIIISIICLWVLIEQRKKAIFLFLFIPLFLILTASTYFTVNALFGYPIKGPLPAKFMYLAHLVVEPDDIYFWIIVPGETEPRSYNIQYNKRLHRQAGEAQKMTAKGNYVMGQFELTPMDGEGISEQGKGSGRTVGGDLSFYKFNHQDMMPKDSNNLQEEITQ